MTPSDDAWRYRETDLWRELVARTEGLNVAVAARPLTAGPPATGPATDATATAGIDPLSDPGLVGPGGPGDAETPS